MVLIDGEVVRMLNFFFTLCLGVLAKSAANVPGQ
jgi:hypothetical protein